ncbi:glycosyltransferase family 2 protein [Aplosporella prunicola CBS 121167]|uniref:Glycosyltransferase family 2 protein n=1 Tax=Aplosporella prunicola CBS 121167 TaxID=1176127 RepID=A0A6A6B7D7_9PEZI|nr:glycosyltransferase family 2 protein [Aplosporella prunicola CBS 121167]KAF2140072.1 glycosyltransferase family 2 protein [Aplosporella prunicola CBS 121167]
MEALWSFVDQHWWLTVFALIFSLKGVRTAVNAIAFYCCYQPTPIPDKPNYTQNDVTVILPSINGDGEELRQTLQSILVCAPAEVILVTIDASLKRANKMIEAMGWTNKPIRVMSVAQANKRRQMCAAIPEVKTKIIIFADDDVIWGPRLLPWILAPFENLNMGGVGTNQRIKRNPEYGYLSKAYLWQFLGEMYIRRRNFDITACTQMDGGLPCLSGRTVAYRARILQNGDFHHGFQNEKWNGYTLNADDDNFITRWMVSQGYDTTVQYHPDAEVQTTLECNPRYLRQCLRWVRSNWRSNLTTMFVERHTWTRQPWSTYAVQQTTLTAWALPYDAACAYSWYRGSAELSPSARITGAVLLALWIVLTKCTKLMPHFVRHPEDMILLVLVVVPFGYLHGLIKLWGLVTLNATTWGSRPAADTDDAIRMERPKAQAGFAQVDVEKPLLPTYRESLARD